MPANDLESSVASDAIEDRESQCKYTSWLIRLFVVANVVVFVASMYINNCPEHNSGSQDKCVVGFLGRFSFQPWTDNPWLGPSSSTLEKLGGLERTKVVHKHQGWRLITCIWLHADAFHLGANMFGLAFIGTRLERQFGFVRIGTIYLLSGFGGSVLSSLFIQHNVSVGAFGAFLGLLGAMLSELITNWTIHTNKAGPLIVIFFMNVAVGTLPLDDNFAHIGGFLTGFLLGFVLLPHHQFGWIERPNLPTDVIVKSKYKNYQNVLGLVSLILLITGLTVGLVMLFRGVDANDHCHWCHYLNCVTRPVSSEWKCNGRSLS